MRVPNLELLLCQHLVQSEKKSAQHSYHRVQKKDKRRAGSDPANSRRAFDYGSIYNESSADNTREGRRKALTSKPAWGGTALCGGLAAGRLWDRRRSEHHGARAAGGLRGQESTEGSGGHTEPRGGGGSLKAAGGGGGRAAPGSCSPKGAVPSAGPGGGEVKGAKGTKGSGPSGAVFGEAPAPRSHPSPAGFGGSEYRLCPCPPPPALRAPYPQGLRQCREQRL